MSDQELQERKRKAKSDAAAGVSESEVDRERAGRATARYGGSYDHLIGEWVLVQGVREIYRGVLCYVEYFSGGARLSFSVLYHIDTFTDETPDAGEKEKRLPASADSPAVLEAGGILMVSRQLPAWPKV